MKENKKHIFFYMEVRLDNLASTNFLDEARRVNIS